MCSNIPLSPAYDVYISQLIRCERACSTYDQFLSRGRLLTDKLMLRGFLQSRLMSACRKFYGRYIEPYVVEFFHTNNWLIDWLRFYVPLENFSLIWRRHHYRWRAAKFRSLLGAQGLWAEKDLYRATPAVTQNLGFSGLIRRTAPSSRLLLHTWECGRSILTLILKGRSPFSRLLRLARGCGGPACILTRILTGHTNS
jgi:hypothetical protein